MNWECNRCGHRVQPVNKEVKPDGMVWPAGSACSRCLNGEMVYRDYNTIISLAGGPLCGNSLTARDGRIPSIVPMFHEGKFYNYELIIEQGEFWTNIHYQYTNEVLEVNNSL